ncbi:leucocin A/sakacin P family class II bacteriocin [Latilactobacillus sakei]|uniref:Prebacteriocin n=2 Tax=Latilactobacillus sakei TaxID=1599 RepID=Q8KWU5_LATSK|nr:leucocin A/sakacin P family class II bacteriocin [Latilactobacillus sakei]AAM73712.1 prebacteriocin SkgA2 [Latilactobacillus sakei]ACB72724.1 prebacteriocin [Latilactobacillus sakei]ACM68469.1 prebacteriocin SkgA2 [Latilactobacillus sakei]AJQ16934.1 prebacteriocin SkgA2 [Latilactobacillus sakei]MCM1598843.1 class II bacteriocin [Latilactobacillus sakei]
MKNAKSLTIQEMKSITGGKYYGNGVSCNSHGCSVNWGQAWTCGVNHLANGGHGVC